MISLLKSPELARYKVRLEEILQENAQRLHISNINVFINPPCIYASLQAENTNILFKMQYDDNKKQFVDTKFTINGRMWNIMDQHPEHLVKNERFDINQQQLVDLIEKIQNKTINQNNALIVLQGADTSTEFNSNLP